MKFTKLDYPYLDGLYWTEFGYMNECEIELYLLELNAGVS